MSNKVGVNNNESKVIKTGSTGSTGSTVDQEKTNLYACELEYESEESILLKTDGDSIQLHSMDGYNTIGKVTEVYDGDTITVIMKYRNCMDKFKIRLIGYDSPELKPRKDIDDRQNVVLCAKEAKNQLSDKILNKIVKVHCHSFEKYGRLLATIYTMDNEDVNEWMIKNGVGCKRYDGGKKL